MNENQTTPQKIGKYEVLGVLGRGAMGVVYRGRDPEIGREVAIKTLRRLDVAQLHTADAALQRFKSEARSAGKLRHPNIITVFEVNRDRDMPYLVMDYVIGEGLDSILAKRGRLEPPIAIHYLSQAAAALDHAHSKGVIHRDIKPSNILVDRLGQVFILDFGVATFSSDLERQERGVQEPPMGSPAYMSPEQILDGKLDGRSDLFSLAIVAFECLTGTRPFPGENFTTVVGNILSSPPLALTSIVPELPLSLEAEFQRALAREVGDRFTGAGKMIAAFSSALRLESEQAAQPSAGLPSTRRRKTTGWRSFKKSAPPQAPAEPPPPEQRERKSTGATFSPWRLEQRPADTKSSQTIAAPNVAKSPGSIFGSSSNASGTRVESRVRTRPKVPPIALGLAGLCFGFGVILLAMYVPRLIGNRPESEGASTVISVGETRDDADILDLSDADLSARLRTGTGSEAFFLKALREAQRRSLPDLVALVLPALGNDSYVVRIEALRLLSEIGDTRAVPTVVSMLSDHDPLVRGHAAKALGVLGDSAAADALKQRLMVEDTPEVVSALRKALDKLKDGR